MAQVLLLWELLKLDQLFETKAAFKFDVVQQPNHTKFLLYVYYAIFKATSKPYKSSILCVIRIKFEPMTH